MGKDGQRASERKSQRMSKTFSRPAKWLARRLSRDTTPKPAVYVVPPSHTRPDTTPPPHAPADTNLDQTAHLSTGDPVVDAILGLNAHPDHPLFHPPEYHRDYWPEERKRHVVRRRKGGVFQIWPLWRWKVRRALPSEDTPSGTIPSWPSSVDLGFAPELWPPTPTPVYVPLSTTPEPEPAFEPDPAPTKWQPTHPGPANRLPPELWFKIISHLCTHDALKFRAINRVTAAVGMDPYFHRELWIDLGRPHTLTPVQIRGLVHVQTASFRAEPPLTRESAADHPTRRLMHVLRLLPAGGVQKFTIFDLDGMMYPEHETGNDYYDWGAWRTWLETEFRRKFLPELARVCSRAVYVALPLAGLGGPNLSFSGSNNRVPGPGAELWTRHAPAIACDGDRLFGLSVEHNRIDAVPVPVPPKWHTLVNLNIAYTATPAARVVDVLESCPDLASLEVSGNFFTLADFKTFPVVRETPDGPRPNALEEVRAFDSPFTVPELLELQRTWAAQRGACRPPSEGKEARVVAAAANETPLDDDDDDSPFGFLPCARFIAVAEAAHSMTRRGLRWRPSPTTAFESPVPFGFGVPPWPYLCVFDPDDHPHAIPAYMRYAMLPPRPGGTLAIVHSTTREDPDEPIYTPEDYAVYELWV